MPFVLFCGLPASGKTLRVAELKTYIIEKYPDRNVNVVSDHSLGVNRNKVYAESREEKQVRGTLKSAVQRLLNKDDVVILDSLNYIKGFRYELYCVTKSCQTPQCVVWCDINPALAADWNTRRDSGEQYSSDILSGLVMRFEEPKPNNRWDSPLIVVQSDDRLPCKEICDAIFERKAPPPNHSTQSQPLSSTNFLHELDRVTQETLALQHTRPLTLSELQRQKRQFISYTKTHPVEDTSSLTSMFVQFLNSSLQ
ncbi:protein KTI12 homolog [Gigantopelta aegis]|uniref:protein KTI12 homolog n=1 Tax=Gigantopelta aegis TaxID=1735272 RepID=UPI001B88DA1F|nr:protein KTI12 homolog [Gigantopelta aegis]